MAPTESRAQDERLAEERAEQARWRPRKPAGEMAMFDRLVHNEFLPADRQAEGLAARLRGIIEFAAANVPYYRDLFARLKLAPSDIARPEDLPRLPELTKAIIQTEGKRILAARLPAGENLAGAHTSSGSTGAPTAVYLTESTGFMRLLLTQRQLRWYRFDPLGSMAWIRKATEMRSSDGRPLPESETFHSAGWPGLAAYFETGPFLGFAASNPTEKKVEWLEKHCPNYVTAHLGYIEHLAFAFEDRPKLPGLQGLRPMGAPLTPGMRARIEGTFGVPVHISFGLDEIGWVATRCTEGGHYHVHTEHCLVEIVDESGAPCRPGEFGRMLITTLSNAAMPLIRYATDDVAQALGSPCPCGRTLPVFGDVIGRYSQMANLPAGTLDFANALRGAMEGLAPPLSRPVREYQVGQDAAGDFELRVKCVGALAPGFHEHVMEIWRRALAARQTMGTPDPSLSIREVESIALAPSGKFFHFVSDFAGSSADRSPDDVSAGPASHLESLE